MTDWGEVYSHVIACTGWTWEYVAEHVDLPRLASLNTYWAAHPPVHMMVAAYLGYQAPASAAAAQSVEEQQFIPAQKLAADEFDAMLREKGLIS